MRPTSTAASAFEVCVAGMSPCRVGESPRNSSAIAMVFAVNWPPQAPAPGHASSSRSCSSSALIVPAMYAPIPS